MDTVIITVLGIIALWLIATLATKKKQEREFREFIEGLPDRIVRLTPAFREHEDISDTYARIEEATDWSESRRKIRRLDLYTIPDDKEVKRQRKIYEKEKANFERQEDEREAHHKKQMKEMGEQGIALQQQQAYMMQMRYGNSQYVDPTVFHRRKYHDFSPVGESVTADWKDVILMPKNFDPITETVMKDLTSKKKGGDKKRMRKLPRIFRYALYTALVVLVWDFVIHANDIATFTVNTFLLHK